MKYLALVLAAGIALASSAVLRAQTSTSTDCTGNVYGVSCTATTPGAAPVTTSCAKNVYGTSCTTTTPGAMPTTTDCSKNVYGSSCTTTTPGAMSTTTDCARNVYGANCTTTAPGAMPSTTNCSSNVYGMSCTTMNPNGPATTTDCSRSVYGASCTSTTPPSAADLEAQQRAHQAEIQNEARGAVAIGRGVAGIFHAIHASNRKAKEARLADLNARFASLNIDYHYGATLVAAAQARGDTAAVRRLSADQEEMSLQLSAIADTAAKVAR